MYRYIQHRTDLNTDQLRLLGQRFEALQTPADLAVLLKKDIGTLTKMAARPKYETFFVPKPGGEKRFIENPEPGLKAVQSEINRYLQAVYYDVKPACAHGFIVNPADNPKPRNIYTNALAHMRGHWFLNLDLADFFHTVTERRVVDLFRYSFGFAPELAVLLAQLCCHNNRLPMGAPSSPAVSNFVFYFLDYHFTEMARAAEGVYTRYADDLTFSFPRPPGDDFIDRVRHALLVQGFMLNEQKVRQQGRLDQPEITGLRVGDGPLPQLSKTYLKTLKKEIVVFRWLFDEVVQRRGLFPPWHLEPFRKSLAGQIEFAGFVLGKKDRVYQKLMGKMRWG